MRRAWILLPIAVLILGIALWWTGVGPSGSTGGDAAGRDSDTTDPQLHVEGADVDSTHASAPEPSLVGRGRTDLEHAHAVPRRGDVEVLIVDRFGQPAPYASINVDAGSARLRVARADASGRLVLRDIPLDGSIELYAIRGIHLPIPGVPDARVTGPSAVVTSPVDTALHLVGVDAETGLPVPGTRWRVAGSHEFLVRAEIRIAVRCPPGEPIGDFRTEIQGPDGFVVGDLYAFHGAPSRYARSLLFRCPLRREAHVIVDVEDVNGHIPEALPRYYYFDMPVPHRSGTVQALGTAGRIRLRGIPFFRDTHSRVLLSNREDDERMRKGPLHVVELPRVELPVHPSPDEIEALLRNALRSYSMPPAVELSVVLSGSHGTPITLSATLPALGGPDLRVTPNWLDIDLERRVWRMQPLSSLDLEYPSPRTRGHAQLRLMVQRRDGSPATGARVRIDFEDFRRSEFANANSEGLAVISGLEAGARTFTLFEHGLVRTSRSLTIPARGTLDAVLKEGEGGKLIVRAVDERLRGLPFAYVSVRIQPSSLCWWEHMTDSSIRGIPVTWADEVQGTQLVDPFTDQQGHRTYDHINPGSWTVGAVWANREAEATVQIVEGETTEVEIVVRPPE